MRYFNLLILATPLDEIGMAATTSWLVYTFVLKEPICNTYFFGYLQLCKINYYNSTLF